MFFGRQKNAFSPLVTEAAKQNQLRRFLNIQNALKTNVKEKPFKVTKMI